MDIASDVMPYVTSAISAYGAAVLTKTTELAADTTVGRGTRILQRIFGRGDADSSKAIERVAKAPDDELNRSALQLAIREALEEDPTLADEIAQMLPAGRVVASGERSVAVGGDNSGLIITGDSAKVEYPR
ncbi:hypothetical protein [Nonomuraea sediminis]|uniref:hypothetical protein n=1 Tax=Nonomuraea sediminis TaxID=2835864 RepID=UPI001BDD089C|nr:hypothetical protein [Nonomuraea sediminis]